MKFVISSLLIFTITLFSKPGSEIDSLKKALTKAVKSEKVDLLNTISLAYTNINNFDEAVKYANDALDFAESINYDKGKVNSYNNLANAFVSKNDLESALFNSEKALNLSRNRGYKMGEADALRNSGIAYNYLGKNDEAIEYLENSLEICKEIGYTYCEASAYTSLGNIYANIGQTNNALETHKNAAILFKKSGRPEKSAHSYLNIGSIYTNIVYDFEKGLEYTLEAKEIFLANADTFKTGYCMLVIGTIYDELANYENSLKYYNDANEIFAKVNHQMLISITYNYIGEVYKKQEKYNKAIEFYTNSLDMNTQLKRQVGIAVALNNIGECYYNLNNTRLALEYYKRSIKILKKLKDIFKMAIAQNNIGKAYQKKGQHDLALQYFLQAKDNAETAKAYDEMKNSYFNLSELYQLKGDYKRSLESYRKYVSAKDSILNNEKSKEILKLQIGYESDKKEQEIELLKKSNELAEHELENSNLFKSGTALVAILVILMIIALYSRGNLKKQANAQLAEQNEKIKEQKDELNRINYELQEINRKLTDSELTLKEANLVKEKLLSIVSHDLKSPFTSIIGLSEFLSEDIEELSRDEIQKFATELHDSTLTLFYLLENLLNWSIAQKDNLRARPEVVEMQGIIRQSLKLFKLSLNNKKIPVANNIPDDLTIYADLNMVDCIFRNIFHNAIKFSEEGQSIVLSSEKINNRVSVSISDNGVGIDTEQINKILSGEHFENTQGTQNEKGSGLGLSLVREFIDKNNGKIEILSNKGEGTTVNISFPAVKPENS